MSFAVTAGGMVGVIELYGRRLSLFKLERESATVIGTVDLPLAGTSICALGDDLFIHFRESDGMIYKISKSGTAGPAFMLRLPENIPLMQRRFHDAQIICLAEDKVIVALGQLLPNIAVYSPKGVLKWKRNLTPFHQIELAQISPIKLRVSSTAEGYDQIISGFAPDRGVLAIQTRRVMSAGGATDPNNAPETRFISLSNGSKLGTTKSLPFIAAASSNTLFAFNAQSGNIQVLTYRRSH